MAVTKDDFARLIKLQEHDKLLDGLRAQIAQVPVDIEALRSEVSGEQGLLAAAQQKCKELKMRRKEKENEMATSEEAIRKHQGDLNSVKTNDAFKALLKEIEEAKKVVGDLETEILELMDAVDAASQEEKSAKETLAAAEAENNKRIQELEKHKAERAAMLAQEDAKRAALADGIPAELSLLYDKTRERRAGVALAAVKDGSCVACNVIQRPQNLVDLRKGTKILTCDSCQRILHEPLSEPAEPAESGA
ncbi:MAG: C4-type zinc ribbon domain-containing protein [Elusimicrobiota bacterium]